jgi:phosphatidylglycerophosphatase C
LKRLTLFDFDGTITNKDTFPLFIAFSKGRVFCALVFFLFSPMLLLYKLKLIDGGKVKERILNFCFKGNQHSVLMKTGYAFMEFLNDKNHIRENLIQLIQTIKKDGSEIGIVSASPDIWILPFCKLYNLTCICTELQFINNVFSGKINGKNCNKEEKAIRILETYDLTLFDEVVVYANSSDDAFMCKLAHQYYMVKSNNELVLHVNKTHKS